MTRSELAVVGAGPAGAYAAWSLARAGAQVTVFDPSHPREKPCGGGLTLRALSLLADAVPLSALPGVETRTLRFLGGSLGAAASVSFSMSRAEGDVALYVVGRRLLDEAMLQAAVRAGAHLIAERVVDVEVDAAGVAVHTRTATRRYRHLLGADGVTSLVRRRLLGPFRRDQLSLAAGCYADGATSAEVVIQCVARPAGYLWSFPRPDHLSIGMCTQAGQHGGHVLFEMASRWAQDQGLTHDGRLRRYAWPIPSLSAEAIGRERPAGQRWMLLGDAAGLVDPLTREGIYFALRSGQMAAAAIASGGDPARTYVEALHDTIWAELARAAVMKARFFTSNFTDLLVDALGRSPEVQRIMVDLIAGRQPYRSLRRRLMATLEVGLAWRLLRLQMTRSAPSAGVE